MIFKLNTVYTDVFTKMHKYLLCSCLVFEATPPPAFFVLCHPDDILQGYGVSNTHIYTSINIYDVDAEVSWIDDDSEGVTWIQCSVCNNWIHELCLPNDYIYSAKSDVFYCSICIT